MHGVKAPFLDIKPIFFREKTSSKGVFSPYEFGDRLFLVLKHVLPFKNQLIAVLAVGEPSHLNN